MKKWPHAVPDSDSEWKPAIRKVVNRLISLENPEETVCANFCSFRKDTQRIYIWNPDNWFPARSSSSDLWPRIINCMHLAEVKLMLTESKTRKIDTYFDCWCISITDHFSLWHILIDELKNKEKIYRSYFKSKNVLKDFVLCGYVEYGSPLEDEIS